MKKLLVLILLIFAFGVEAQTITPPYDSTSRYHLKLWGDHANPGATALNQNMIIVDSAILKREAEIIALREMVKRNPDSVKFVSAKFLGDSITSTFATVQSAINNSGAGSLIYVYPGVYDEADTGKTGVDIYLTAGAILAYSGTAPTFYADGVTCSINGEGTLSQSNETGSNTQALKILNSSYITVTCNVTNQGSGEGGYAITTQRFSSAIYVKRSHLEFNGNLIYSKVGSCLAFDSLSTGNINNTTLKSRASPIVSVFSRRKVTINNSYLLMDSNNFAIPMVAISADSSKFYISYSRFEQLDNQNFQTDKPFIWCKVTSQKELTKITLSNCNFYTWSTNPTVDPITTDEQYTEDVEFQGTGLLSRKVNNDTITGEGTQFLTELTPGRLGYACPGGSNSESFIVEEVLNDTTLIQDVTYLSLGVITKCPFVYYAEGSGNFIDTAEYSIVVLRGINTFPNWGNQTHIKLIGNYNTSNNNQKVSSQVEELIATNYKNRELISVPDGKIYVDSGNAFIIKLNTNTFVDFISNGSSSFVPMNLILYRSDTTEYALSWDTTVIWADGIDPPPPDINMIDVYSFVKIPFGDNVIGINNKIIYLGTLIRSFPIPY